VEPSNGQFEKLERRFQCLTIDATAAASCTILAYRVAVVASPFRAIEPTRA